MVSITLLAGIPCVIAQQQAMDSLVERFDAYRITHTTEKIYLHVDQTTCLTGEIMWFKAYLVNATTHKPSTLSAVAYIELLDNVNHAVLQAKIAIREGVGSGSLFIPASLTSGHYRLRAYTNWMKNFNPAFYFHQQITVINPFTKPESELKAAAPEPDAQFYPEGGNLLAGVTSRIAFRTHNTPEPGGETTIEVIGRDTIVLRPDTLGMGVFEYTATNDHAIRAFLITAGKRYPIAFPTAADRGYALSLDNSESANLQIILHSTRMEDRTRPVYLLVHTRNAIGFARGQFLPEGNATIKIPRSSLAGGISHITLFDADMRAVCERLYFNPAFNTLRITAKPSQREFGIRRKVTIDLDAAPLSDAVVAAHLSMAVYRRDPLRSTTSNIVKYVWLDADLTDAPELPDNFLDEMTADKQAILDNVMLTSGWRRFAWREVVAGGKPVLSFTPEMRSHIIRGQVTSPDGTPASSRLTYLASPGFNIQVYGSISNKAGEVYYEMKDFSGPRKIMVQPHLSKDSTSRIEIFDPFSTNFAPIRTLPFSIHPETAQALTARTFSMQVQDIFYRDKGTQFRSTAVDTTAFYGKADATYYLDDYTRFPVMEEVMREYVPGVFVRKRRDGFHFINLDVVNKRTFDEDPFIMLDGLPVFDADRIMTFDPRRVKKLEVITRRYYMGVLSLPGIVSYSTYGGDLAGFDIDPRCLVLNYEGLQMQRTYYMPKYETAKERASRMPDQRDRLFWDPQLSTDQNGKRRIEFYTSDLTGEYEVLIEGMDKNGVVGSGRCHFRTVSLTE